MTPRATLFRLAAVALILLGCDQPALHEQKSEERPQAVKPQSTPIKVRGGFEPVTAEDLNNVLMPAASPSKNELPPDVRALLEDASELVLYSLDPLTPPRRADAPEEDLSKDVNRLHGWDTLGKTNVNNRNDYERLIAVLMKGIDGALYQPVKCFNPRHAIRIEFGGKQVDLMICFECNWVYVYVDGVEKAAIVTHPMSPNLFDELLIKANVTLAPKTKQARD